MSISFRAITHRLAPLTIVTLLAAGMAAPIATAPAASAAATVIPNNSYTYTYGYYLTEEECIDEGQYGIDNHDWVDYRCNFTVIKGELWALVVTISYTT